MTVPPIAAFATTVSAVERLSPALVRITLTAPDLAHLDDGGPQGPRDLRIKVMIPSSGHPLPDLSHLSEGWYTRWLALDPDTRGEMRTYTVRRTRLHLPAPEVDVDFVLHGDGHGPASSWAGRAAVGDPLTLLGPDRRSGQPPAGIEWRPPATGSPRVLLVGDETAAPAICSILESLPADAVGHALVEVPDSRDRQECRRPAGVDLVWLARDDAPRGQAAQAAVQRVLCPGAGPAPLEPDGDPEDLLWDTPDAPAPDGVYAWVAGEAAMVRALRRHLVGPCGLDRSQVAFMGYWREGAAG